MIRAVSLPAGGEIYTLSAWPDRHAIRSLETYDAASEAARAGEQARRRDAVRKRRISILLSPLAGHLPAAVQERMESEFGAPARALTIVSALPLLTMGLLALLSARIAALGGGVPFLPWLAERPFLSLYISLESGLRLCAAFLLGEPMGSLPGVLGYELWSAARRREAPPQRLENAPSSVRVRWPAEEKYKLLEPLLALLTPEEQKLLLWRFGFEPIRWGKRTSVVLLLLALANVLVSLLSFASQPGTVGDLLWLLAGGWLAVEQIARRRRLAREEPAGSALGGLVRPLARDLLAGDRRDRDRL